MMTVILEAINNVKNELNNNINSNSQAVNDKFEIIQAENAATREELLTRINDRSRLSSRASSRATSPRQLAARLQSLHEKMPDLEMPLETPRVEYSEPQVSMTEIFANKKAADDFEDVNRLRDRRKPAVSQRDNTISRRETFAAINRPGNPVMKETFTRTTPENRAHLSSPLTLEKCLTFERDMLDFQQKYNVEVRYTNYVDTDLKYEIRARFGLTDSDFYELSQQGLHRCLSEMIAPMTKSEFLSMLKTAVHFSLPRGYIPTEQNVGTFLNQLLVYKEKLIRAIEFLLLHPDTDAALPSCDSKPLGLLRLISDEVPFEFIQRMMNADGPKKKYENVFEFFKRIALKATEHTQLSKAAKVFSASFGGTIFDQSQRNHQYPLADTTVHKEERTPAVAAVSTIPYRRWTPRVVATMESVHEEDEQDENEDPDNNTCQFTNDNVSKKCQSIAAMTASAKLNAACFRMVNKNSCSQVNCEYSHDEALIAAARDKQMADLMAAKRDMQAKHQETMRTYDTMGAKVLKYGATKIERRPLNPEEAPTISLLTHSPGSQLDEHIGREHECFQRIALLSERIPANILSHGCQTEIVLLCVNMDLVVKAMLDTGCSPGNYMSLAFYLANIEALKDFLVPCAAEKVDLATSNSAQHITLHLAIEARHVDSRGVVRTIKLRVGILKGLRFDVVIGLYAISLNFMEVIQDLLTIQLAHQEARTNTLARLYGGPPQLLMLSSDDTVASSA